MITIKLKLEEIIDITKYQQQYTNIVHFAYNRLKEGQSLTNTEKLVSEKMNNIELLDSSFIKVAVNDSKNLINKETVIFGGKKNWNDYNNKLITKEEYKKKKLLPIMMRGSTQDHKGNRKFQLDIPNHKIIFKPNRQEKLIINLPKTKQDKTLLRLQELCEENKTFFTIKLSNEYIWISFDETILKEKEYKPIKKRILAIDLNPNYISLCVRHGKNILHKEIIGLKELNKQSTNKKKYEGYEISKRLVNIAKHYKCEYLCYEKLEIESNDKGKGRWFNKACNNDWRRKKIIENLNKRCNILGIKVQEVIPQYSSFIGQIQNEGEYDSVAAAIELSRRCHLFISYYVYKDVQEVKGNIVGIMRKLSKSLVDHWKKKLDVKKLTTYKSLYLEIKNMKYSYRNLFHDKWFSCRMKSDKSCIFIH